MEFSIRDYHHADFPYLFDICRLTGDSGGDATNLFSDPFILGQVFAAPYVVYEPRCCLVLAKGGIPIGYVLGARDTRGFARWMERYWLPALRARYPLGEGAGFSPAERRLRAAISEPPHGDFLSDEHPAHLHIDILPEGQGSGWGRRLMDAFMERLAVLDCRGVQLGVAASNERALRFYAAYGLERLHEDADTVIFGKRLRP
jgi:ribosomal protein S18 acetylase RimI-like enzyme